MSKKKIFLTIAFLEGLSYLVLLLIAMPMKYMMGEPWLVSQVGMAHGLLFMAYVYMAIWLKKHMNWNNKQLIMALVLSVLPAGTFFVSRIGKGG